MYKIVSDGDTQKGKHWKLGAILNRAIMKASQSTSYLNKGWLSSGEMVLEQTRRKWGNPELWACSRLRLGKTCNIWDNSGRPQDMSCVSQGVSLLGGKVGEVAGSHLCNYLVKKGNWHSFCDGKFLRFMTSDTTWFMFWKDNFDVLFFHWILVDKCIYVTYIFVKTYMISMCFIIYKLCLNIFKKLTFPAMCSCIAR